MGVAVYGIDVLTAYKWWSRMGTFSPRPCIDDYRIQPCHPATMRRQRTGPACRQDRRAIPSSL